MRALLLLAVLALPAGALEGTDSVTELKLESAAARLLVSGPGTAPGAVSEAERHRQATCTLAQTVHLSTLFGQGASPFSTPVLPTGQASWEACAAIATEPGNADAVAWCLLPNATAAGGASQAVLKSFLRSRAWRTAAFLRIPAYIICNGSNA